MDHNVLMCFPLRCFHFNRGLLCLNHKATAGEDLLLATCGRVALSSVQGPEGIPYHSTQQPALLTSVTASRQVKAWGTLFKKEKREKKL